MDPDVEVQLIVSHLEAGEWKEAYNSLYDLREWLRAGGMVPHREYIEDLLGAFRLHLQTKHRWK